MKEFKVWFKLWNKISQHWKWWMKNYQKWNRLEINKRYKTWFFPQNWTQISIFYSQEAVFFLLHVGLCKVKIFQIKIFYFVIRITNLPNSLGSIGVPKLVNSIHYSSSKLNTLNFVILKAITSIIEKQNMFDMGNIWFNLCWYRNFSFPRL